MQSWFASWWIWAMLENEAVPFLSSNMFLVMWPRNHFSELSSSSVREGSHRSEPVWSSMLFKDASLSVLLWNENSKDNEESFLQQSFQSKRLSSMWRLWFASVFGIKMCFVCVCETTERGDESSYISYPDLTKWKGGKPMFPPITTQLKKNNFTGSWNKKAGNHWYGPPWRFRERK